MEMRSDDWVARFIVLAKRMRMATGEPDAGDDRPSGSRPKLSGDRRQATFELRDILLPLHQHLTQAQIDRLLYDDDRDVRLAAATTLGSKNDELRRSALKSAWRGMNVDEVLANRRRARGKSLPTPALEGFDDDELIARFIDAGERKALADRYLDWGTRKTDRDTCGRQLREMYDIFELLKARGRLEKLRPLMDNTTPRVRLGAAIACLTVDEPKALATLDNLEKTGWFIEKEEAHSNLLWWSRQKTQAKT